MNIEGYTSEISGSQEGYTISEDGVAGYTSKTEGSAETGFTVTNTKKDTSKTKSTKSTSSTKSARSTTGTSGAPKTGDNTNTALWLVLLLLSGGILIAVLY